MWVTPFGSIVIESDNPVQLNDKIVIKGYVIRYSGPDEVNLFANKIIQLLWSLGLRVTSVEKLVSIERQYDVDSEGCEADDITERRLKITIEARPPLCVGGLLYTSEVEIEMDVYGSGDDILDSIMEALERYKIRKHPRKRMDIGFGLTMN